MVSRELVLECLDILELKYLELESGDIAVTFSKDNEFPYDLVTFIEIKESILVFSSRPVDFKPIGDLYAMANRHNYRSYAPVCHISEEGEVIMESCFLLEHEVSPHYLLNNVIRPSMFLPLQSYATFELSDDELEKRRSRHA